MLFEATISILSGENTKLEDSIKESEKDPFTDFDDISASVIVIKKFFPLTLSPLILIIYLLLLFKKSFKGSFNFILFLIDNLSVLENKSS